MRRGTLREPLPGINSVEERRDNVKLTIFERRKSGTLTIRHQNELAPNSLPGRNVRYPSLIEDILILT